MAAPDTHGAARRGLTFDFRPALRAACYADARSCLHPSNVSVSSPAAATRPASTPSSAPSSSPRPRRHRVRRPRRQLRRSASIPNVPAAHARATSPASCASAARSSARPTAAIRSSIPIETGDGDGRLLGPLHRELPQDGARRARRHRRRRHARASRNDFHKRGIPIVGVPKTIDNDIAETTMTFGFDTAVAFATDAIDRLHTTAESHHRIMVVEVMGRYAGWIALYAGIGRRRGRGAHSRDPVRSRRRSPSASWNASAAAPASASSSSPKARSGGRRRARSLESRHAGPRRTARRDRRACVCAGSNA